MFLTNLKAYDGILLWLTHFLSARYSPIFCIFNRTDIRLDSPERKVAPKIVIKIYTKLYMYLTPIHQMVST